MSKERAIAHDDRVSCTDGLGRPLFRLRITRAGICPRLMVVFVAPHVVHPESVVSAQCKQGPPFPRKPGYLCAE